MYDGPFGLVPDGPSVPRWTWDIPKGVNRVEYFTGGPLSKHVVPARMVAPVHKIHTMDHPDEEELDLTQAEKEFGKRISKTIIQRRNGRLRDRSPSDDLSPENIVNFSDKMARRAQKRVEDKTKEYRAYFMNELLPSLVGYDIAAGETEAVARDILETEVEIDGEAVEYIERVCIGSLIAKQMSSLKGSFSQAVIDQVMINWMTEAFTEVRESRKKNAKNDTMRRMLSEFDGLIARRSGASVGVGKPRRDKVEQQPVETFYVDR